MASRTRSLSRSRKTARKGQFFILTTVAIVTILFFVSRWTGSLSTIDTSSLVLSEELFTADNIKEKTEIIVKGSENCDELRYNLQEYRNFLQNYARGKNYQITYNFFILPCYEDLDTIVEFDLEVVSSQINAKSNFFISWP